MVVALQISIKVSIKWSQFDWNTFERVSADGPFFSRRSSRICGALKLNAARPCLVWTLVNSRCVPDGLSGRLGSCRIRRSPNWTEPYFDPKPFKALWSQRRILKRPLRVGEPVYRLQNGTDMILFSGVSVVSSSSVFLGRLARMLLPPPPQRKARPGFFQVVFLKKSSNDRIWSDSIITPRFSRVPTSYLSSEPRSHRRRWLVVVFFFSFSREVTRKSDRRLHPGVTPVSGAYLLPRVYTRFFNSHRPDRARQRSVAPVEMEVKKKNTHTLLV